MRKALIFVPILLLIVGAIWWFRRETPRNPQALSTQTENPQKFISAFMPYWNLSKIDDLNFDHFDTIYYFAVDLNPDGSFNKNDPGWSKMNSSDFEKFKSKVKSSNKRLGLTIVNLDPTSIAKNVNSSVRRNTLITSTIKLMKEQGFVDLNIDLEYTGDFDTGLKENYTTFVKEIVFEVKKNLPESHITLDVFADSATKLRIFDLSKINEVVDGIFIMAYDFNRISSYKSGSGAPLNDINASINDFIKIIPAQKLILGIPLYGYEWPTENNQPNSFVVWSARHPEISSYTRSMTTAQEKSANIIIDDKTKTPWFSYYDQDSLSWRQVWFEDENSIRLKINLVKQLGMAGVGFFALGYEGEQSRNFWSTIFAP